MVTIFRFDHMIGENQQYPFIALQVEKENIKTYVIEIIIQPLAKTGEVISSKEHFQAFRETAVVLISRLFTSI